MQAAAIYLDTNIFLRHLRNDHPTWSPACQQVFKDIESGSLRAWTSELAIAEVVFILESKKHYNQPRPAIASALLSLLLLPKLTISHKNLYRRVFQLYTTHPKLSYVDCHTATLVEAGKGKRELFSFDTDFDALKTIIRREPPTARPSE